MVELAADRAPDICQSQSINIFLPGDVDKWDLHMLHWQAWERGVKSPLLSALQVGAARGLRPAATASPRWSNAPPARAPTTTSASPCQ
ncbi:MAG: hypothetical protein WDM85_17815 [Caulobacteraceae bacterium]